MLKRCFCGELPAAFGSGTARWIAPAEASADRAECFLCRCRIIFLRPETVRLHFAADSVYRLWIDGEFAAEGAELGDHRIRFVDSFTWNAAPGEHTLVAAVPFFGPKGAWARMDVAPGFFCAAEGAGAERLISNSANWQVADAPMFRWRPPFGWATPAGEELIFDASLLPEGIWQGADDAPAGARRRNCPIPDVLFDLRLCPRCSGSRWRTSAFSTPGFTGTGSSTPPTTRRRSPLKWKGNCMRGRG